MNDIHFVAMWLASLISQSHSEQPKPLAFVINDDEWKSHVASRSSFLLYAQSLDVDLEFRKLRCLMNWREINFANSLEVEA